LLTVPDLFSEYFTVLCFNCNSSLYLLAEILFSGGKYLERYPLKANPFL